MSLKNKVIWGLVLCLAFVGLAYLGTPEGHSYRFNMSWAQAFHEARMLGDPYPRYLPGLWQGFGGKDFYFYAPLPFYLSSAVQTILPGLDVNAAFAIMGAGLWVASAISGYIFLRVLFPSGAAQIGAGLYAVLPYHLTGDWVIRQAIGEFAAYIFLPLVAFGIVKVMREQRMNVILPLSIALISLSHLLITLLTAVIFLPVVMVWGARHRAECVPVLWRLILLTALGLGVSAVYWGPAILHLQDVSADFLSRAYFRPENWLLWDGRDAPNPGVDWGSKFLLYLSLVSVLVGWLVSRRLEPSEAKESLLLWSFIPVGFATFLMSGASALIWTHTPLSMVQFPWRLLSIIDFGVAVSVAYIACFALPDMTKWHVVHLPNWAWLAVPLFLTFTGHAAMVPVVTETYRFHRTEDKFLPFSEGALEYLSPMGPRTFLEEKVAQSLTNSAITEEFVEKLKDVEQSDQTMSRDQIEVIGSRLRVISDLPAGRVRLPILYHPEMSAIGNDGQSLKIEPDPEIGLVVVIAEEPHSKVRLELGRQKSEVPMALISAICLCITVGIGLRRHRKDPLL